LRRSDLCQRRGCNASFAGPLLLSRTSPFAAFFDVLFSGAKDIEKPERRFRHEQRPPQRLPRQRPHSRGRQRHHLRAFEPGDHHPLQEGGRREGRATDWFQIVALDGVAKSLADLGKGDLVGVVGRLRANTWEKDGVTRTTVEVVAQSVEFLRLKKDREAAQ
jgi:hypothetical protein